MAEPTVIPITPVHPDAPYWEQHPAAVVRARKPWMRRPYGAPPAGVYMVPGEINVPAAGAVGRLLATVAPSQQLYHDWMFQIVWDQSDPIGITMGQHKDPPKPMPHDLETEQTEPSDILSASDPIAAPGSYRLVIECVVYDDPVRTYRQPIRVNLS
jgi:hypothetical protein